MRRSLVILVDGPEKKASEESERAESVPAALQVAVCTVQSARASCTGRCNGLLPILDGNGVRHRGFRIVKNWRIWDGVGLPGENGAYSACTY